MRPERVFLHRHGSAALMLLHPPRDPWGLRPCQLLLGFGSWSGV